MSLNEVLENVNTSIKHALDETNRVNADRFGLDPRAGRAYVLLDEQLIVVESNYIRTFDYYGGFEYVDSESRQVYGDYTVFSCDDDRIAKAIEMFEYSDRNQD